VEKAKARINSMNQTYAMVRDRDEIRWATDYSIPSYAEWKKDSEKGIGFFATRRMQISFIDDHIKAYHLAVKKNDDIAQYHHLIQIQFHAFDHLTNKGERSRRHDAVVRLVGRVRNAMNRLRRKHEKAPVATNFEQQPEIRRSRGILPND
jgi:hypothetical protein